MAQTINIPPDLKILVICETGTLRDLLSQSLRTIGLKEIEFASAGLLGLKLLRNNEAYGLVLCERDLTDLSGLELLREAGESEDIEMGSFILVSSAISKADVAMAAELGCDGYLIKPFTMKDLATKITRAMQKTLDADCLESCLRRAKNLGVQGKSNESINLYTDTQNRYGEHAPLARISVGIGRGYRKTGKLDLAHREFSKAIDANPKYVHAFQERGLCNLDRGDIKNALEDFDTAIKISPNNPVRYELIAELLYKAGEFSQAEEYLLKAVKLELAYPELFAQLGRTLFAQKKPERAAQFLEKALRRDPKNTSFLNSLGICYKEMGQTDKALERYNQALKMNPTDVKVLFNKALCLVELQQFDRAEKTCELILKTDPGYIKAQKKLEEITALKKSTFPFKKTGSS